MATKTITVMCFSEKTNAAVIAMPGRKFPGLVIQGDTLRSLCDIVEGGDREGALDHLKERLTALRKEYERVLRSAGLPLPYFSQD
jgi:hypothetical protein